MTVAPPDIESNHVLAALAVEDRDRLRPHLEHLDLAKRHYMERPGTDIADVYFPTSGLASVVAVRSRARDQRVEIRLFGRDGMSGLPIVTGTGHSPHEVYMQIAGTGLRLPADSLRLAMSERPTMVAVFLRYLEVAHVQTAHTALANGKDTLEVRLARWILMAHDRSEGDDLDLTHEFLSLMLGVRRAGVTVATHSLEGRGLIRAARGHILVLDRDGLIDVADGSYGVAEAEYERLFGRPV